MDNKPILVLLMLILFLATISASQANTLKIIEPKFETCETSSLKSTDVDDNEKLYVAGVTSSALFTTKNPYDDSLNHLQDAFATKLSSSGDSIEYSTFVGGLAPDWCSAVDIDNTGRAYITGYTKSIMFPTKNGYDNSYNKKQDVFVTKLSSSGDSIEYSSFIGGNENEMANNIRIDEEGYIYLIGFTTSDNFPLINPIQNQNNGKKDVFIMKLNPSGTKIIFSTLIGGSDIDIAWGLAIDDNGSVYVTGRTKSKDFPLANPIDSFHDGEWDAFVFKLSPQGDNLDFSTYIGGSKDEWGYGIDVDSDNNIFISGNTSSKDFPLKNAFDSTISDDDAYLVKINSSKNTIEYSTYMGGCNKENSWGLATDSQGNVYICGRTFSEDFPIKDALQSTKNGDCDIFISKFSNDCYLNYSTFLGGSGVDDANRMIVDKKGCAYFTAYTTSTDFPIINPFDGIYNGKRDAYITKLSSNGDKILYSSYLGGRDDDDGYNVALDDNGCFYVVGYTKSMNFPIKNAYQHRYGGFTDAFITKFSPGQYHPIREVAGGLLLSATFDSDDEPLNWSINVEGKTIFGGKNNGTISPYSYKTVKLGFILGFGKANITIAANDIEKYYSAFMLGPFFLNLQES